MTSKRESILAQIAATLSADGGVGGMVYRSRQAAQQRTDGALVIVEPAMDQPSQNVHPLIDWRLTVHITVIVRGVVPDQSADPIVAEIHRRVMSDLSVGGYAYDVQPTLSSWEMISADRDAAFVTNAFDVLYRTSMADISQ